MESACWNIIQGIGTLVIGFIAIGIAYQQWRTNKNKLKFDLYTKRYDVYLAAKRFYLFAQAKGNITDECLIEYNNGILESDFLFKPDVNELLKKLREQAVNLQYCNSQYRDDSQPPHPGNYNHEEISSNLHKATVCFNNIFDDTELKAGFKKYLDFSKVF